MENNENQIATTDDLLQALSAKYPSKEEEKIDITILKFALYARRSTKAADRQERSIPDQKLDCFDTADRLGIPRKNITVIEEYESAKEPDVRPLFKQMIDDIKVGKLDAILAWHPDRLARNMADAGKVIDLLDKKILKNLTFATFSFEDKPMGKMLLGISFVLSKQYSDHLSESVLRGQRRAIEAGKSIQVAKHGFYKDADDFLRPDGENWLIVKHAFEMRLNGETLETIVKYFNHSGYSKPATKKGENRKLYRMTTSKLAVMLADPIYAGVGMFSDQLVDLTKIYGFEPILSVNDFVAINELKDIGAAFKMVRPSKKRKGVKADFLRGKVFCSFCGKPMSSGITTKTNKTKDTTGVYYYRCETENCQRERRNMRARVVWLFALDFLEKHIFATRSNYEFFLQRVAEASVKLREELDSQIRTLRRLKTENEKTKERIKNILLKNDPEIVDDFKNDLKKIKEEGESIDQDITKTETELAKIKEAPMTYEKFLELLGNIDEKLKNTDDLGYRDSILSLIFSNFIVDNEKVANYGLNEPFSDFLKTGDFLNGRPIGSRAITNRSQPRGWLVEIIPYLFFGGHDVAQPLGL